MPYPSLIVDIFGSCGETRIHYICDRVLHSILQGKDQRHDLDSPADDERGTRARSLRLEVSVGWVGDAPSDPSVCFDGKACVESHELLITMVRSSVTGRRLVLRYAIEKSALVVSNRDFQGHRGSSENLG